MDASSHELFQSHERRRGEREREGVISWYGGERPPMVEHEGASFPLKSAVGSGHGGVIRDWWEVGKEKGVDHQDKGEAFEEGESEVGQGVDREVGPDRRRGARHFPIEWDDVRGKAGAKGPVGVLGPSSLEGGKGSAEVCRGRVDGGGGTDKAESSHPPFVGQEDVQRSEA